MKETAESTTATRAATRLLRRFNHNSLNLSRVARYCDDCRNVEFCQDCENPYCEECREVEWCDSCGNLHCAACRTTTFCETCETSTCDKCPPHECPKAKRASPAKKPAAKAKPRKRR